MDYKNLRREQLQCHNKLNKCFHKRERNKNKNYAKVIRANKSERERAKRECETKTQETNYKI